MFANAIHVKMLNGFRQGVSDGSGDHDHEDHDHDDTQITTLDGQINGAGGLLEGASPQTGPVIRQSGVFTIIDKTLTGVRALFFHPTLSGIPSTTKMLGTAFYKVVDKTSDFNAVVSDVAGVRNDVNVVMGAPTWGRFDTLGAGNTTIFARSNPVADTDPTHATSATLPAGGTNTSQLVDDGFCEATRILRLASGGLESHVQLRGRLFKQGGASGAEVLFTLPSGYRPLRKHHFSCRKDLGNDVCHFQINNAGECRVTDQSDPSFMILDGVSFWTN